MSLETDIKQQKPFASPFEKATVNLIFTNNWLITHQANVLKPFDITMQQYNVLRILRGQHPCPVTVNAIIERMLDKMSNASRLIDKLLAKELVSRKESKKDRRACDVVITKKGLEILEEINKDLARWSANTFSNMTTEEAEQLSNLLDKLRANKQLTN